MTRRLKFTTKPILTDRFTFRDGLFTAYISDIREYTISTTIALVNPNTGNEVKFDLVKVDRDAEGETVGWYYDASEPSRFAGLLRVLVIND